MMMGMILGGSIILVGCQPESEVNSEDAVISGDQVPQIVQNVFAQKYPGRTPQWESQPYGYEAVFSENGIEYEVELSADGRWLETEYEVSSDEQFPAAVLDQVRSRYPGYQITKREIEITPKGVFYEVEVENGSEEIELYFDGQGNLAENYHEDV
ncbi:PepSY-like domain-containing protein [Calothrix sp. NIES-3974]|uniref:PepSY-like domain-containing protein n=1 Tax=Calothrix sp. NIES-3974 TaxID=2005462 RepID=UPI000B5E0063|nr:PepSY-like domain-containing protein [Calothrix sp. NIES-3974]BAZ03937.1 hypothetical protein NIES3974_05670 [Calothrix sp. NIES-3974]